jgi:hypothetical protein
MLCYIRCIINCNIYLIVRNAGSVFQNEISTLQVHSGHFETQLSCSILQTVFTCTCFVSNIYFLKKKYVHPILVYTWMCLCLKKIPISFKANDNLKSDILTENRWPLSNPLKTKVPCRSSCWHFKEPSQLKALSAKQSPFLISLSEKLLSGRKPNKQNKDLLIPTHNWIFSFFISSPDLKAQVSFSDRPLSFVRLSICL